MSNTFMYTSPERLAHTQADRQDTHTHTKTPPSLNHDPDELKLSAHLHLNQERMRADKNRKNIKRSDNGVKE